MSFAPVSPTKISSGQRHRSPIRRRLLAVLIVLLLAGVAIVWQLLLNSHQNSMVTGRPLSFPGDHLHTVAMSEQFGAIYLGTHYGLFTSTDNGRTWPQKQGKLNTEMITSIAVSPTNPALLAIIAIPTGAAGVAGIYVSSDGGKSWTLTQPAYVPGTAYPYAVQGASGGQGHFYAFFSSIGWFETLDLGRHWHAITGNSLANIQTPVLLTDPADPQHLLMGGDLGLFETFDDGTHWHPVTGVQGAVLSLLATNLSVGGRRTILCSTERGLYRWQDPSNESTLTPLSTLPTLSSPTRLALSSDGKTFYALFGQDLWFSPDLGTTWTRHGHFTRGDITALVIDPHNPRELLAGFFFPGLVLLSTDSGNHWSTLTN